MRARLHDLIVKSADSGLRLQDEKGFLPGGHNGPWNVPDTHVRTTAHWALAFNKAHEITGDERYLNAATAACDYLLSGEARPYGRAFHCIKREYGMNLGNGLIGQAWAIEPLIIIGSKTANEDYIDAARSVIAMHPYDHEAHSWSAVDIEGKATGEHEILNQQIWMTTVCIMLGKYTGEDDLVKTGVDFLAHVHEKFHWLKKGMIGQKCRQRHSVSDVRGFMIRMRKRPRLIAVSKAYLTFLLYGLAMSYELVPEEGLWNNGPLKDSLEDAVGFVEEGFPYGFLESRDSWRWSYNPTGIEMAYILQALQGYLPKDGPCYRDGGISRWLELQFEGYYDTRTDLMNRNTGDPDVLAARLYEARRINDCELSFDGSTA